MTEKSYQEQSVEILAGVAPLQLEKAVQQKANPPRVLKIQEEFSMCSMLKQSLLRSYLIVLFMYYKLNMQVFRIFIYVHKMSLKFRTNKFNKVPCHPASSAESQPLLNKAPCNCVKMKLLFSFPC